MPNIGIPGLIIILVVALIVFGPNKLPELGRAFGRTLREFKEGTKDLMKDDDEKDAGDKGSRVTDSARQPRNEVEGEFMEVKADAEPREKKDDKRLPD